MRLQLPRKGGGETVARGKDGGPRDVGRERKALAEETGSARE